MGLFHHSEYVAAADFTLFFVHFYQLLEKNIHFLKLAVFCSSGRKTACISKTLTCQPFLNVRVA